MAQYAQHGGQQGAIWGDFAEWPAGAASLTHNNNFDNINSSSILDQNDTALLAGFFQNPDHTTMDDSYGWFPPHSTMKTEVTGYDGQLDGYDLSNHTVSNPSVTLSERQAMNYQTHTHQQHHVPMNPGMAHPTGNRATLTSDEEFNAASHLFDLSVSQNHSIPNTAHMNGAAATAGGAADFWRNGFGVMGGMDHVRSPVTSSGRQSRDSHATPLQTPNPLNDQLIHNRSSQQQQQDQWAYWLAQQQTQNTPRAHHPSLHLDTSTYQLFPHPEMRSNQVNQSRGHHSQRPTGVEFGSDRSFNNMHFQPPKGYVPNNDEKSANLNNVPFASRLAADGHSHAQAFIPNSHPHSYARHSVPNSATHYIANPLSSSPAIGGLPLTSPPTLDHRHSYHYPQMAHRSIENCGQDGIDEDKQPRKRRKSQMQREEEAEYVPYGAVKAANPKRGTKTNKTTRSDYEDNTEAFTPPNPKPLKRRRSTATAQATPGSDDFSPTNASEGADPNPGSKKKSRRNSQGKANLSEEQKRQNHIQSEKTRRDLIKMQYEVLDALVPALKSGKSGLSRADVLEEIVAYVGTTVQGNKEMIAKLSTMSKVPQGGAGMGGGGRD